jgi:arylsulfatase A-like enzyme
MTGRYSIRPGLSWFPAGPENTLQPDEVTLAEILRDAGYHTGYIGKWHLEAKTGSQPQNQGFDEWRVGFSGSSDGVL